MTDAPNETPAIAALPDDAARLARAANEKPGEAMAIAELNATFNEDRAWFKAWPEGWTLDPACFGARPRPLFAP
jgi:hypothetical protein